MISSETRLHSGEGTVRFEMVGDLFVNLLLLPPTFSNILLKIAQHFSPLLLMPGI
jgi:hypothetical protein